MGDTKDSHDKEESQNDFDDEAEQHGDTGIGVGDKAVCTGGIEVTEHSS